MQSYGNSSSPILDFPLTLSEVAFLLASLPRTDVEKVIYYAAERLSANGFQASTSVASLVGFVELPSSCDAEFSNEDDTICRVTSLPLWEYQSPTNPYNLASLLHLLELEQEHCILTIRKIHRLGFKSARVLRHYFSRFGRVDKVMLLPSRPKSAASCSDDFRARPASMGFVVMGSSQSVRLIVEHAEIHLILGWPISVQEFVRRKSFLENGSSTDFSENSFFYFFNETSSY